MRYLKIRVRKHLVTLIVRTREATTQFGLAAKALNHQFRKFKQEYQRTRLSESIEGEKLDHATVVLALSLWCTGFAYLSFFGPLVWTAAKASHLDPGPTALMLQWPPQLDDAFFGKTFPHWSAPEARPIIFGFGTLYGAIAIVGAFVRLAGGLPRLALTANGLCFGFYLTRFVGVRLLHILPASVLEGRILYYKLAYLMLSYYLSTALTALLSKDDFSRKKFEFLLGGAQALFSGWLLTQGFHGDAAVYSGAVYLACTFLTMSVSEYLFRVIFRGAIVFVGRRDWSEIMDERHLSIASLRSAVATAWRTERCLVVVFTFVSALIPLLAAGIYVFLLEST